MKFLVKALSAAGAVVRVDIDAGDAAEARRIALGQGLNVLALRPANPLGNFRPRARSNFAIELFSRELISLLDTGLSLVEAIETLSEQEQRSAGGAVLEELRRQLYRGQSFSYALEQAPQHFPELYVVTVRAAEETGDIKEALGRYLDYHAQVDRVRRRIVSASIYPILLVSIGGLVTLFMLFYVVPKFSSIYEGMGSNLPFLTQLLIQWGQLIKTHAVVTLLGLVFIAGTIGITVTRPQFKRWLGSRLWAIPAIGDRLRTYELARFYRTLGMLLKSGMPLPRAIDMSGALLSPVLRNGLERAAREIREGDPVSRAFQKQGLTTPIARRLLGVGERSGRMPEMVDRIASFYEDELTRWVDWFMLLFEPALMVVIGAIIGLILVLLYLPIFELAENVK
jgi:general secretion pathway protein F